jgi:hypothetical protein
MEVALSSHLTSREMMGSAAYSLLKLVLVSPTYLISTSVSLLRRVEFTGLDIVLRIAMAGDLSHLNCMSLQLLCLRDQLLSLQARFQRLASLYNCILVFRMVGLLLQITSYIGMKVRRAQLGNKLHLTPMLPIASLRL